MRWIRRILPVSIVGTALVLAAIPLIGSFKMSIDLPFEVGRLSLSGSRLTMELPKLSGFTDDNRGYSVTAKTASQDLTSPDLVDLADIEARLEMADKGWTTVAAKTGTFDVKRQFITLGGGVDLAMKGGYGGILKDAEIDVKAGTIVTRNPVVFTYLDGKLVSDQLTVSDRGAKAMFEGNVQLDFRLTDLPSRSAPAPAPGARPVQAAVPAASTQAPSPAAGGRDVRPVAAPPPALPPAPLPPRRPAGLQ